MDHDWLLNELRCSIPHTPMVNFALGVWARSKKSTRKIFLPGYVHASKRKRLLYYIMKDRQVVAIKPCPYYLEALFLPGIKKFGNLFKGVKTLTVLSIDGISMVDTPLEPPLQRTTNHVPTDPNSVMLFFIVFTFARSKNVFIVQTGLFNVDSLPALYYDMTTERQIFLQLLPIFDIIIFATWKY